MRHRVAITRIPATIRIRRRRESLRRSEMVVMIETAPEEPVNNHRMRDVSTVSVLPGKST